MPWLCGSGLWVPSSPQGEFLHRDESPHRSQGDQTLSATASHELSDPRVSILHWSSCRSCCSPEVLLLRARPGAGRVASADLAPLQLRFLPPALSPSLPRPAGTAGTLQPVLKHFPALLGGIFAGRGRAGNAGPVWESSWDPPPASASPQHRGFGIPGDVMEIPVDKGLDGAHVMNIVC